jgi:PAS domain-containing protein
MAYELTSDVIRSSELSVKLQASDAALRESEQRMSLAVEAEHVGLWVWDIGRDEVWTTEETRSPFGISTPERPGLERFLSSIHTDDRERVRAAVAETLSAPPRRQDKERTRSVGFPGEFDDHLAHGDTAGPCQDHQE